ncbi:MAG: hypothetical protein ACC707_18350 [Thiohalomonadales bacterium]
MFGSEILEIVIALIFLYTLLSVICSSINEFIATLLNSRASNLYKTLHHLLDNQKNSHAPANEINIISQLLAHPLVENLKRPHGHFFNEKAPSYIPANIFTTALLDTIVTDKDASTRTFDDIKITVGKLPDSRLRASLLLLINQASGNIESLEKNIEEWFDSVMERASGWYKRKTYTVIFYVSLLITVLINADSLMISESLWKNTGLRTSLVTQAEQLTASGQLDNKAVLQLIREQQAQRALPIGWRCEGDIPNCKPTEPADIFTKIVGLFLTVMAVSLGAPFWFDVLNRIVSLRSTGRRPQSSTPKKPTTASRD